MTTVLKALDVRAQTDGHPTTGEPVQVAELSSQRAAKKLAIRLMSFLKLFSSTPYEMDLSQG
ncbi:hypothetical protein GXB78_26725 [Pseudomonas moraviensis subsp. stanleyae]|uniref:hypothetical protein n=1 Tax=Pseudomonas moraviensis TaxID=321662 RepID=UPI002E34900B|nr:hypothetical protein [Pseudomonas moraviensis]MED7670801.1 hypothetical protein [Pseudomonas moraviensis subsp. stanleyae]